MNMYMERTKERIQLSISLSEGGNLQQNIPRMWARDVDRKFPGIPELQGMLAFFCQPQRKKKKARVLDYPPPPPTCAN